MGLFDHERLIDAIDPWVESSLIFDQFHSTHAFARDLLRQMDEEDLPLHPTMILAERQTAGEGRLDRTWVSPPGGLYVNFAATVKDPSKMSTLPMAAAGSLHKGVTALGATGVGIKWPNDLLVGDRKLAGMLAHAVHGGRVLATIGFGINIVEAPDLDEPSGRRSVSIQELVGDGDPTEWAITLITTFLTHFSEAIEDPSTAIDSWKSELIHRPGDPLTIRISDQTTLSGTYVGINSDGFLMLDTDDGRRTLSSGDVMW